MLASPDTRQIGIVHVHSCFSHDGRDSIASLRTFARDRGIAFIAMSDHAEDFDEERYHEFLAACNAQSDENVHIFPGLEFRFSGYKGLHLLALGLREWIRPETPAAFADLAPAACDLTVLAHPRLTRYRVPRVVRDSIAAVEVWNAAYDTRYLPDAAAIRLLHDIRRSRPEVIGIAGLDQHDARNDRETRVITHGGSDSPLKALRAGNFHNAGRTMCLGSTAEMSAPHAAVLSVASVALRVVNQLHDRVMRDRKRK